MDDFVNLDCMYLYNEIIFEVVSQSRGQLVKDKDESLPKLRDYGG